MCDFITQFKDWYYNVPTELTRISCIENKFITNKEMKVGFKRRILVDKIDDTSTSRKGELYYVTPCNIKVERNTEVFCHDNSCKNIDVKFSKYSIAGMSWICEGSHCFNPLFMSYDVEKCESDIIKYNNENKLEMLS